MHLLADTLTGQLHVPAIWWVATFTWFGLLLIGDLYLNRNQAERMSFRKSAVRSVVWIALGIGLGGVIWAGLGADAGSKYYAGYFIEKALSVDNMFVWGLILGYLNVPQKYHYKVLFWGIFGAIVFRVIFVLAGITIIEYFQPALIILGLGLLVTSYRLLSDSGGQRFDPEKSRVVRIVGRVLPLDRQSHSPTLFVRQNGRRVATMLFFAICVIELTDIVFAVDSVPTSLAIVRDPYIVLASNIAALLGLRALYFVFEWVQDRFYLLNKGLAIILSVVAVALILEPKSVFGMKWFGVSVSPNLTIGFVGIILTASILLSLAMSRPSAKNN